MAQLVSLPVSRPEGPEKFGAVCRTCNISEVYHTELGARYFDLKHAPHDVQIGALETQAEMNELQVSGSASNETIQRTEQSIEHIDQTPKTESLDSATSVRITAPNHDSVRETQTAKQGTNLGINPRQRREPILKKKVRKRAQKETTLPKLERKNEMTELTHESSAIISSSLGSSNGLNLSQSQLVISQPAVTLQVKIEDQVDNQAPLLLGKLSFVKEGESHRVEAIRVSTALNELRWRIEPPSS